MRERQLGRRDEQAVARAHERSARKKGRADVADCAFYGFGRHLDRRDDMDGIGCEREVRPSCRTDGRRGRLVRRGFVRALRSETERFSVCKVEPIEGEHAGHAFDLGRSCRSVAGGDGGPAEQGVEPARTPALRCGGMRDEQGHAGIVAGPSFRHRCETVLLTRRKRALGSRWSRVGPALELHWSRAGAALAPCPIRRLPPPVARREGFPRGGRSALRDGEGEGRAARKMRSKARREGEGGRAFVRCAAAAQDARCPSRARTARSRRACGRRPGRRTRASLRGGAARRPRSAASRRSARRRTRGR